MRFIVLLSCIVLSGCTAIGIAPQIPTNESSLFLEPMQDDVEDQKGDVYMAKYATTSALNSHIEFVSDTYGEIRIAVHHNGKMECRWWGEGKITDPLVYAGTHTYFEVYSTLCIGKLQEDGTFDFNGVYFVKGNLAEDVYAEEERPTFRIRGKVQNTKIRGEMIIGGVLASSHMLLQQVDTNRVESGVQFEAALE